MKQLIKKIVSLAMLASTVTAFANEVTPTLVYRSQGFHSDRQKMVGMVGKTHLADQEGLYGVFDASVGYMRSFKEDRIARCLFGDDLQCDGCDNVIKVQGSDARDENRAAVVRDEKAWLADYLYLNCEFNGQFTLKPRIQNVVVDLDFYLGLDEWREGLYFRAWGPLTWTKWQTNFCSSDVGLTTSCSAGYMTPSGEETLLTSLTDYFAGKAPSTLVTDQVMFQGLKWARMPNCDQTKTGLADLRLELGWDFWQTEDSHIGVGVQIALPTGSKRSADYVMQPVVGNGNHVELGGVISAHSVLWRSENEERHFGFYLDANIMHMFKNDEQRTYDLKGKNNSRYMLASKFRPQLVAASGNAPLLVAAGSESAAGATAPTHQFASMYAPVANLTTIFADVSVGVQSDVTAMFNFTSGSFGWDFGYNFYGRNCETIDCPTCPDECNTDSLFHVSNQNRWVLKGDTRSFGYRVIDELSAEVAQAAVALSASNSKATINKGDGNLGRTVPIENGRNFGADNAGFARSSIDTGAAEGLIATPRAQGGLSVASNRIESSLNPVFIKCTDIELQTTRGISHTVFTNLSYTFDRETCTPFVGVGGSAEFGQGGSCKSDCDTDCDTDCKEKSCKDCFDCALSQWSFWVKGGVSFN